MRALRDGRNPSLLARGCVSSLPQCFEIAQAALGEPVKQVGQELFFLCPNPNHVDHHPSLQINRRKNVWMCGPCGASGNAWQLAAFISGLDRGDNAGVVSWLRKHGFSKGQNWSGPATTVDDLARDKQLPEDFLRSLQLKNIAEGVLIPYHLMDGSRAPRHRLRTAIVAKEGSRWDSREGAIVPYGLEKLVEAQTAGFLVVVEGESDCWTLWHHCFPALGIPGAQMVKYLRAEHLASIQKILVVREPDSGGSAFVAGIAKRLEEIDWRGEVFAVTLDGAKDPNDLHKRHTADFKARFQAALEAAHPLRSASSSSSVWTADTMEIFLDDSKNDEAQLLHDKVLYRGTITELFSPRGIGKSLFATHLAVQLARNGLRVLLLDRDNPTREVRARLRSWGADANLRTLKVITREKCPTLTNAPAWGEFPYLDFDVVILDSFDSMAEGVGEQDSSKPSRAIAAVLDLARREGGPGVLILGNCVRTGKHSRGSGVIEDRSDIVLEVRDCTNFHPSGKKPWIEELPAADAASWALKSSRRKGQAKLRLAFIPTKFRIGEEPEPFAIEIDTSAHPWSTADVTDSIDQEGAAERERQAQERASAVMATAELLKAEILRRETDGESVLLKKQAEEFLMSRAVTQKVAREAINSPAFEAIDVVGKGHPKGVRVAAQKNGGNRNTTPTETAVNAGSSGNDFGQPHPERPTEFDPPNSQCLRGSRESGISVEDSFSTPAGPPAANSQEEAIPLHNGGTQGIEEEL
jgi:AAA domain